MEVAATPADLSASTATSSSVRTDAQGRFALTIPGRESSRTLRFYYRSSMGTGSPTASATLALSVRAAVMLAIAPRAVSAGGSVRFTGRLLGGPIPREGKQLVLEARAPGGRWIEFDDVRTSLRGNYHASYRFRFPGPARYQFRVLSEPESDYPYAQGASNIVEVTEQ